MAAWREANEETSLAASAMDFSPLETLDRACELIGGETLDSLSRCLDSSILSIFDEPTTVEPKGLDENETMLLTALTEILDNVDDENPSPFDTLPDSELLSNQKTREHSPLRRMPKAVRCTSGKIISRTQTNPLQRSDGEEEEFASLSLSLNNGNTFPSSDLLNWDSVALPLPITFQQDSEDDLSVSLGNLVRHMHPYCMTISIENEQGVHTLPEGGLLLEVVDKGENGEPILAIPNLNFSTSVALSNMSLGNEGEISDEGVGACTPEHISVDDDVDVEALEAPIKIVHPVSQELPPAKDQSVTKDSILRRNPTRKKKKPKELLPAVEGRVLRSGTVCKRTRKPSKQNSAKDDPGTPQVLSPLTSISSPLKSMEVKLCQTKTHVENASLNDLASNKLRDTKPPSPNKGTVPKLLADTKPTFQENVNVGNLSASAPSENSSEIKPPPPELPVKEHAASVSEGPSIPETKSKSLSLEEYRRLRQQRKPTPVDTNNNSSTKWPELPELPKELPPIPCLLNSNLKDPRCFKPQMVKNVEQVRPAWQPRGPCAPPTPEALLVPPAYMTKSSSKVSATSPTPKPQRTQKFSSSCQPSPSATCAKDATTNPHSSQTGLECVSQSDKPLTVSKSLTDNSHTSQPQNKEGALEQSPNPTAKDLIPTAKESKLCDATGKLANASTKIANALSKGTSSSPLNISTLDSKCPKPFANAAKIIAAVAAAGLSQPRCLPRIVQHQSSAGKRIGDKKAAKLYLHGRKQSTQELIEAFTSEIGIEAADLTSLLEQFENTQAKKEHCVPEVSGRAAAVGNSSVDMATEKTNVGRVKASDLATTAALTPPATPPQQLWKPLTPVVVPGRSKTAVSSKVTPSKAIQIEAKPLPSIKARSKTFSPSSDAASAPLTHMDHDYCLPSNDDFSGRNNRWNVKQQSSISIKTTKEHDTATSVPPTCDPLVSCARSEIKSAVSVESQKGLNPDHKEQSTKDEGFALETAGSSLPIPESESSFRVRDAPQQRQERSYRQYSSSRSPSPRYRGKERTPWRSKRSHHSPSPLTSSSDSCSSRSRSRSHSPVRKRYRDSDSHSRSSSSSSCRSSPSVSRSPPRKRRYSYSSSRSGSWSRSRSRSPSPLRQTQWGRGRQLYSPTYRPRYTQSTKLNPEEAKRRKEKAIEERRIVYVGRIRGTMTQKELKDRFSVFGRIEECTLHFRDHGDNYGFVTFFDTKDAFTAIENGCKLRKPDELPFDLCFGGRRQFCQSTYADLDSSRDYEPLPTKAKLHALDFDTLLKQAQQNLRR